MINEWNIDMFGKLQLLKSEDAMVFREASSFIDVGVCGPRRFKKW